MAEALKDQIKLEDAIRWALSIQDYYDTFDPIVFEKKLLAYDFEEQELKARIAVFTKAFKEAQHLSYEASIVELKKITPFTKSWLAALFPTYIEFYGLEFAETSIDALAYFTSAFSSEFAIRPFIEKYPDYCLAKMLEWTASGDKHIRRLASEGCRPRLPWASPLRGLIANPKPIMPILDALIADQEEYVRRSVANNLNDISKDHPSLCLSFANRYFGQSHHTNRLVKHALRTLLKKSHPEALALFGYDNTIKVDVINKDTSHSRLHIGQHIEFTYNLKFNEIPSSKIRCEFEVEYVKANNKRSIKRFQIGDKEVGKECKLSISKRHSFEERSTRKHYEGLHTIKLIVNGIVLEDSQLSFDLIA